MKAERRHELKHNELSDWLVDRADAAKPHVAGIVLGIAVLALLIVGGTWYFGGQRSAKASAWSQYFAAFNDREPEMSLSTVAAANAGTKAAWWALLSLGDLSLGEGSAQLYTDRDGAKLALEKAAAAYKQVEAADDPILQRRARLGLAKVYESMCKPEEAYKYYELVAESEKDSAIGNAAAADAKRMKDPRVTAFLAWFVQQTPKRPAPLPGMGGALPNLPSNLPDRPDIGLPGAAGVGDVGAGIPPGPALSFPPAATEPAATQPAATSPATPPAEGAPTAAPQEKPAVPAPPAPEAKPAEPPAGEKKAD
jgi:hypothetical protein